MCVFYLFFMVILFENIWIIIPFHEFPVTIMETSHYNIKTDEMQYINSSNEGMVFPLYIKHEMDEFSFVDVTETCLEGTLQEEDYNQFNAGTSSSEVDKNFTSEDPLYIDPSDIKLGETEPSFWNEEKAILSADTDFAMEDPLYINPADINLGCLEKENNKLLFSSPPLTTVLPKEEILEIEDHEIPVIEVLNVEPLEEYDQIEHGENSVVEDSFYSEYNNSTMCGMSNENASSLLNKTENSGKENFEKENEKLKYPGRRKECHASPSISDALSTCLACKVLFPSEKAKIMHCNCEGIRRCNGCIVKKTIKSIYPTKQKQSSLQNSLNVNSGSNSPHVCNTCEVAFPSDEFLKRHCSCCGIDICIECFSPHEKLEYLHTENNSDFPVTTIELQTHKNSKTYLACNLCGDYFPNHRTLLIHEKKHKMKYCENCGQQSTTELFETHCKQCQSKNYRKRKEKFFRCKVCSYKTKNNSAFIKHNISHSKELLHVCKVCHKAFRHKWSMTRHAFLHTGLKPYICNICNAAFADQGNCKAHQRCHSGLSRIYTCKTCFETFLSSHSLRKHMLEIHS